MAYDDDDDYSHGSDDSHSHKSKTKKADYDEPDERLMNESQTLKKRGYSPKEQSMIEEWLKKNKPQGGEEK